MPQPASPTMPRSVRRDGWTPARQIRFLDMLARTRSVTRAARAAGMSRESAYRLRKRDPDGLLAAAWDRAMQSHNTVSMRGPRPVPENGVFVRLVERRSRTA